MVSSHKAKKLKQREILQEVYDGNMPPKNEGWEREDRNRENTDGRQKR